MDPKFQTSFIPKKPLVSSAGVKTRHPVSIFMTAAVIIFILSIGGAAFALVWERVLASQEAQYQDELAKDQNQFNTSLISTLSKANQKIDIANQLLKSHLASSQVFDIVSKLTISTVRWKSFDFSVPDKAGQGIKVAMEGDADSFASIAYQSDVFGQSALFGTNKVIKNPVLSNLSVQPGGHVAFSFTATVDPSELSYTSSLAPASQ